MPKKRVSGSQSTETEVSDVLVIGGIVIVGGITLYSIATILGDTRALARWTGGGSEYWAKAGTQTWDRFTGAPRFYWTEFWNQTTGQEGLGITNKPEGERGFFQKDEGSWGYGWGPKKGFTKDLVFW